MRFRLFTDIPFRLQYRVVLPVLVLIFAASIFFIVRSYIRHRRELSSRWIIALILLRTLAVLLLFLSILKPVIGGMADREQLGKVAVFIDNSRSMEVEDAVGERSRLDIAKWYLFGRGDMKRNLSKYFSLEKYVFGKDVSRLGKGDGRFPMILYTEKDYYNVGEEIKFELQTTEDIKDIEVLLKRDGREVDEVKLEPVGEDGDRYSSSVILNEMSEYKIEVSYQGEKRSVHVVVGDRLKEIMQTRLDDELLKRIAYSSGGKYFDISARSGLIDALRALLIKRREIEEEIGIWDTPWPFVVFVLLVATEWFLRRWRQLI